LISFALTVLSFIGGTLIPAYIALYLIPNLKFVQSRYIAALGVGLTFWFFFDTMGDASDLDVNSSIYPFSSFGGVTHFAVIAAFAAGIATLAIFDRFAAPVPMTNEKAQPSSNSGRAVFSKSLILIPIAVAAVMGIHGLGEGWDFGHAAAQPGQPLACVGLSGTSSQLCNLVNTFGDVASVISYPLHKFFEATIIAAVYTCYVKTNAIAVKSNWQIPMLGLLFGLTSVIGSAVGYYVSVDTTYFYAFGVTAALYAVLRLAEAVSPNFRIGETAPVYLGWKVFLAMGLGFFLLYTSALLH
jgi:hypothetical protein